MPRNGSGGYSLVTNTWNPAVNGVTATAADWQSLINDIATAIQGSIAADGQTQVTGNLQMGGFKLTGLAAGTGTGQSLRFEQLFSQGSPASVASAATVDIGIQNTVAIEVTGNTGPITSLGTNYNGPRFLRFASNPTITYNATTLNITTGADVQVSAGDLYLAYPNVAGNGWNLFLIQKASGAPLVPVLSKNLIRNGSFAINQRVTLPTTDNAYGLDGWRLMLGAANAATWTQDTADVPTGAGYAAVLTVGAGSNNKFGIFQPIENKFMLAARGQTVSIRVPLKATAGLTNGSGKIRIGIMQWTGTADSISADPISAWNAEGTNPTLIASWAFANTPAAISVTTSWADYLVENVSISASATNLGVLIWCDETSTTTTTDILRIGGYVTFAIGAKAPLAQVASFEQELSWCQRYYLKTFDQTVAPATNTGNRNGCLFYTYSTSGGFRATWTYPVEMRVPPTLAGFNPNAANTSWRGVNGAIDYSTAASIGTGTRQTDIAATASAAGGEVYAIHLTAIAEL